MNLTSHETLVLLSIAKSALVSPWGDDNQVERENKFYEMCEAYGLDIEEAAAGYCCKATTRECMEYCLQQLNIHYNKEEMLVWETIGEAKS